MDWFLYDNGLRLERVNDILLLAYQDHPAALILLYHIEYF